MLGICILHVHENVLIKYSTSIYGLIPAKAFKVSLIENIASGGIQYNTLI